MLSVTVVVINSLMYQLTCSYRYVNICSSDLCLKRAPRMLIVGEPMLTEIRSY